jgi:large conductance mechanosensitive channel
MWREFKAFLLTQNVLALAIAVIIGAAVTKVVTALVEDIIMPLAGLFVPAGTWRDIVLPVGSAELRVGSFLGSIIDLLIIGFVVWQMSKRFITPPKPEEKPATRACPFCKQQIDAAAVRCAYCTSELAARVA